MSESTEPRLMNAQVAVEREKTREHIAKVRHFMRRFAVALLERAELHDASKLKHPEAESFAKANSEDFLAGVTYGSDEYQERLRSVLGPALDHHYANNRHHPEHHEGGVDDMNLVDIVEMLCDWRAATERHDDGDIRRSIEINSERFDLSEQTRRIMENTIDALDGGEW